MLAETASIYFMTELRFLPIEDLRFGKNFVRELYMELAKPGGHSYENLRIQTDPPTMSTKRMTQHGEGMSACQIGADTILIEETEPELNVDGFIENVHTVFKTVARIKEKAEEQTPPVFMQRCVIRCLAKPGKSKNSISLLAGKVSNVLKAIEPFERPPQFFGVRFRFPPFSIVAKKEDGSESEVEGRQNFASIRFETWSKDVQLIWMEIEAVYVFQEPIAVSQTDKIGHNIHDAYQFLTEKCANFLNQFDDMPEPEEDDSGENESDDEKEQ